MPIRFVDKDRVLLNPGRASEFRGAHAPSRAGFGALAETNFFNARLHRNRFDYQQTG